MQIVRDQTLSCHKHNQPKDLIVEGGNKTVTESNSITAADLSGSPRSSRDIGVGFLGISHVIRGCWTLYLTERILWWYVYYQIWPDEKLTLYGPPFAMVLLATASDTIVLAAGVGMLFSARWGWWLAGFVYSYVIVRSIYMIAMMFIRKAELQEAGQSIDYTDYVFLILLFAVLLMYLYSNRARSNFELQHIGKLKSVLIQFAIAIATLTVTTAISYLIIVTQGMAVPWVE